MTKPKKQIKSKQYCYKCKKHIPIGYPVLCNPCVQREKNKVKEEKIIKSRNAEVLKDFVKFCRLHRELRFWQALCLFVGGTIYVGYPTEDTFKDTFFWEGKDK